MKIKSFLFVFVFVVCLLGGCNNSTANNDTNQNYITQRQYDELYADYLALLDSIESQTEQIEDLQQERDALSENVAANKENLAKLQQQYDELYAKYYDKQQLFATTGFDFLTTTDFCVKVKQYINMGRDSWLTDKYVKFPICESNVESVVVTHNGNEVFSRFYHFETCNTSTTESSNFVDFSLFIVLNDYNITNLSKNESIYIVGAIDDVDFAFSSSGKNDVFVSLINCCVVEG